MTEVQTEGRRRKRDTRTSTAIRFPELLNEDLHKAAEALGLPINFLVNYAVRDFLDHMIDPTEFTLTRRGVD